MGAGIYGRGTAESRFECLGGFSLARPEFGHEGCMDECIWNHTHLCKGFLEDYKLLQEMYEITVRLCDPAHGSNFLLEIFR